MYSLGTRSREGVFPPALEGCIPLVTLRRVYSLVTRQLIGDKLKGVFPRYASDYRRSKGTIDASTAEAVGGGVIIKWIT